MSRDGFFGTMGGGISGTITDDDGNALFSTSAAATSPSSTTVTGGGLGDGLVSFIQRGLWNADFVLPPPSADSAINATNALPYWSQTIVSGTSVSVTSAADSASASGRVLRFAMSAGAAGDEVYQEQIVRVNGSRGQSFAYIPKVTVLTPTAANSIAFRTAAQYLKKDGTTTGAADTLDSVFSGITGPVDLVVYPPGGIFPNAMPTDAYYLRLRIGIRRGAAAMTDTGEIDVCEARVLYLTDEVGAVDQTTGTDVSALRRVAGVTTLRHSATTGVVISDPTAFNRRIRISDTTGVARVDVETDEVHIAGTVALTPSTQTISAASATIIPEGGYHDITVSGGPHTLTSTPTMVDGTEGEEVTLVNVSGNAVTIQDQGTLAGSNLRLTTTTFAISTRDSIKLRFSSTIGDWVEVSRSNVI